MDTDTDESGDLATLAELERRLRNDGLDALTPDELERVQRERRIQYRRDQEEWHRTHGLLQPDRAARERFKAERRQAVATLARACLVNPNMRATGRDLALVRTLRVRLGPQRTAATQRRSGERRPRAVRRAGGNRSRSPGRLADDPDLASDIPRRVAA